MSDVLDFVVQVFEETKPLGENFMAQLEQVTRVSMEPCSTIVSMYHFLLHSSYYFTISI